MTGIAVLTPDLSDTTYASAWPGVLERIDDALQSAGLYAVAMPWTDHAEDATRLLAMPLVLPLVAWGYHRDHARWLHACRTWNIAGVPMANAAPVLAWNSDKRYLAWMAERGVPVPATTFCDKVDSATVARAFAEWGAQELILKPTVSGGAWQTTRVRRGEQLVDAPTGAAMIQPYLPTIESEGETSLVFLGGALSHVVNKRPLAGDFRVQQQHGGHYTRVAEVSDAALAVARQALATIDSPLLYARIDVVPDADGRWLLMEAELIEPDLYLQLAPTAAAAFADAVAASLDQ